MLHPVLVVEAGSGALLGLVSMQVWNRGVDELAPRRRRGTRAKESQRWIAGVRQAATVLAAARTITAGFDIEAADIADPQAMINLVVAAAIAAVTIKQLVQARDGDTRQRLADAFDPDDAPVLEAVSAKLEGKTQRQRNPHPKGSLAFAAWVIARLGGWTGYYGKPGPKVMRIGLAELNAIKYGFTLRLQNV